MATNYVKFQRGTQLAYETLVEKNQIDDNTLYFIYSEDNNSTGSLYLGNRLISGGETNYVYSTLDDLTDVDVSNADINSFLIKNDAGNWVSKTPKQIAELIQQYINNEESTHLIGDNLSVEIIDNVIQLKNYGTNYYAFVPAVKDENNNIIEESKYILKEGFKEGLEPKIKSIDNKFIISWYEPNPTISNITTDLEEVKINITKLNTDIIENKTSIENLELEIEALTSEIGIPATDTNIATGLYKEISNLNNIIDTKANIDSVYTKNETETVIKTFINEAEHLTRKIVTNINDIDKNTNDALKYIYMVPTGLQYEDDKYDEYIIVENNNERHLEKIGSWEVDLSDYAKLEDLNNLEESNLSDNLNKKINFITSVNENNFSVVDGTLNLNDISISQIINLQEELNKKVNAEEGSRLINNNEIILLESLAQGNYDNFITGVDDAVFEVVDGTLSLLSVPATALNDILGDLGTLPNAEKQYTLVDEINEIHRILTWADLTE